MKENIGIVYVFSHFQDQLDNKKEKDDRVILHPRTFTHDMSVNFKCLSDASSISVNSEQYIENTIEQLEKFLNEKFIDDMSVKICYLHKFELGFRVLPIFGKNFSKKSQFFRDLENHELSI